MLSVPGEQREGCGFGGVMISTLSGVLPMGPAAGGAKLEELEYILGGSGGASATRYKDGCEREVLSLRES